MDKSAITTMFAEVKANILANNIKLNSCTLPHDFSTPVDRITHKEIVAAEVFCKWKCTKCGAIVDQNQKHWYELGLKHGGGK